MADLLEGVEGETQTTPVTARGKGSGPAQQTTVAAKLNLLPSHQRKMASLLPKLGVVGQKLPVSQFVHWVIDELCGRAPDWTKPFGEGNARPMIDMVKIFVTKSVGGGLKKDDIVRELNEFKVPEEQTNTLVECILVRYSDVQKALTAETARVSAAHLKDFDWKLLYSLASDKMATLNEPILRLNLTLKYPDLLHQYTGDENENLNDVVLELPKAELDKLISTFQQINQVMLKLRV